MQLGARSSVSVRLRSASWWQLFGALVYAALTHTYLGVGENEGAASLLHILPSGVAGGIVGQKAKHE